jgi:hypothetical protein
LFGEVNGGLIRDLTVHYNYVTVNRSAETYFGGIAGFTTGTALIENILVTGTASVTVSTDRNLFAGGIAGLMTGTSKIKNVYGGLNLTATHNTATNSSIYSGGVAGSMGAPTAGAAVSVENAMVVGDLNVSGSGKNNAVRKTTDGLFAGGIAGLMLGKSTSDEDEWVALKNAHYRQGNISVRSNTGAAFAGGAVGKIPEYAKVDGCSSAAASFAIDKIGNGADFCVGGFIGDFNGTPVSGNPTGKVEDCYSEIPIAVYTDPAYLMMLIAGGFAGRLDADIKYCYATGEVSARATSTDVNNAIYLGGFAAIQNTGSTNFCYASGKVSALGRQKVYAGGFLGYGLTNTVSDCYALGDGCTDNTTNSVHYAGGLIGYLAGSSSSINRSFAKGTVNAQRHVVGSNLFVTGGLVGRTFGYLTNSAALGASVTATGSPGTDKGTGRVHGYNDSTRLSNNHAYNGMKMYIDDEPGKADIAPDIRTSTDADSIDGKDAHLGILRDRNFWKNDPPGTGVPFNIASHGLGFKDKDWIFTTVESRYHPILRAYENGPAMGGQ